MGGELIDLNMENQEKPIPMFNPVEPEEIQFCSCIQITQAALLLHQQLPLSRLLR
jgi:hypothetical protein